MAAIGGSNAGVIPVMLVGGRPSVAMVFGMVGGNPGVAMVFPLMAAIGGGVGGSNAGVVPVMLAGGRPSVAMVFGMVGELEVLYAGKEWVVSLVVRPIMMSLGGLLEMVVVVSQ